MINVLTWYLWVQVFALCGWLVSSHWLRALPDRGYGISKALGLLLGGFVYWIVVTLGLSRNEPGAVLLALAVVALVGLLLRRLGIRPDPDQLHVRRVFRIPRVVVTVELLFAIAFVVCALYRAYNPEIVEAGGEKFMESMYLNAILRSPTFPPNDAWLSGFAISYYYFGYILLAMLAKISGIAPGIAFNLGGATIFALTLTSAFGVGYNLWAAHQKQVRKRLPPTQGAPSSAQPDRRSNLQSSAIVAGLLTATMLGVMGNLGGLMEGLRCERVFPQSFWVWLNVRQIDTKPLDCAGFIPMRFYWWWDWSRVVHDYSPTGGDQEVITETPSFSFILGDNHPHVMSLPFVLIAVTLALLALINSPDDGAPNGDRYNDGQPLKLPANREAIGLWVAYRVPDIALTAIVIGGLSFMNTWDFPVYGTLVVGALLIGRWYRHESLLPGIAFGMIVFALGYILYLPFYATFASQARGIGINLFNGTRFIQFLLMFAPFLVAGPVFIWQSARADHQSGIRVAVRSAGLTAAGIFAAIIGAIILGLLSPQGRAYAAEMASSGSVMGVTREAVTQRLMQRLTDPWVPLYLAAVAALCSTLILSRPHSVAAAIPEGVIARQGSSPVTNLVLLLFLGGALLTLAVEFVYLQDLFGTRMNTVFKFYYQAWTVWAVASAFALMFFLAGRGPAATVAGICVGSLLLAGLMFPVFAAIAKTNGFAATPTLDGASYLQRARPDDAKIIDWLNQNVHGAPVIAEAPADKYGSYSYNGRISVFTGLPTLLGWGGHEQQWRGNYNEPGRREPLIEKLFNSTNLAEAQQVIDQFKIRYVIVGQPERAKYAADGLAKFGQMCAVAFQTGDSFVYRCN